jgi:hypothetical protein
MVEVKAPVVAVEVVSDPAVAFGLDVRADAGARRLVRRLGRMCRGAAFRRLRRLGTMRGDVPGDGLRRPRGRRRSGRRTLSVLLSERGSGPGQDDGESERNELHDGLREAQCGKNRSIGRRFRMPR